MRRLRANGRWRWAAPFIAAILGASCVSAPVDPGDAARQALAPTGKLRVGLYPGSPGSTIRDPASGEWRGVGYELGRELARRLGVPFEPVILQATPQILEALKSGAIDMAFAGATAARAKDMDFTAPYLEVEDGFLVPAGSAIAAPEDIDRAGVRLGVIRGSTSDSGFSHELKHAAVVRAGSIDDAIALLSSRSADAFATNKANLFEMSDKLAGSRVLDGRYRIEQYAIAIAKGSGAGLAFANGFVVEAKAEGLVRSAVQRAGLRGVVKDPR